MYKLAFIITLLLVSKIAQAASVEFKNISPEHIKQLRKSNPEVFNNKPLLSEIDKAIKVLYSFGDYETVQGRTGLNTAEIVGIPTKKISDISISGNSKLSTTEVSNIVGLIKSDRFDRSKAEEGAIKLKDRYAQLGFYNTKVEIDFKVINERSIDVEIKIDEKDQCKISNIYFLTNNESLKNELVINTKSFLKKSSEVDTINELNQGIRNYLADNRYLTTTISSPDIQYNPEKTQASLSYTIERPYKFVLLFEGNVFYESSEILKRIAINSENPTGTTPTTELSERIKSLYRTKGFAHIEVSSNEQVFSQNFTRRVTFKINEGPRVRIRKFEILGTLSKPESFYLDILKDHNSSLSKQSYYSREYLDTGLLALTQELQNRGYLKARVQSTRVDYSKEKDFVTIQILLDEGPQTHIASINFKGNTKFTTNQLTQIINMQAKQALSIKQIEESLRLLQEHYTNHGFLDMIVTNPNNSIVTYNEDNTKATLNYEIYEGPLVKVASISIEGNEKTDERVIRTELEFKENDILTPELINDSIYRLQKTALFSEVSIGTLEKGTQISDRTVIIRVSERNPGVFSFGIGINTEFEQTIRGYLGQSYRNIGGKARSVSWRVELKKVSDVNFMDHKITTGYMEPYLFNSRTHGLVNLTRSYSIQKRIRAAGQVIAAETNEAEFQLEREFTRHLKIYWTVWGIVFERTFEIERKREESSQIVATVGPVIELDYRDNPINPTKGHFTRLNSEYSDPMLGSSDYIRYTRSNAVFSHYLRLGSPNWVWANSTRGGYIKNLDNGAREGRGVPESKIFFLGGRSTIRGFDPLQIPRRSGLAADDKAYYLTTESYFYLLKSELRFPIYGILGGVFFYDGGAVIIQGEKIDPAYRDSIGAGLRFNTPVGPVSFEYGHKLRRIREMGESEGRFHFSMGTF